MNTVVGVLWTAAGKYDPGRTFGPLGVELPTGSSVAIAWAAIVFCAGLGLAALTVVRGGLLLAVGSAVAVALIFQRWELAIAAAVSGLILASCYSPHSEVSGTILLAAILIVGSLWI